MSLYEILKELDIEYEEIANDENWLEGHRFRSLASSSDIKAWTDSLK